MSKVIVLSGPPACGKSTYANRLAPASHLHNYVVVSSDEIRAEINGDVNDQRGHSDVFAEADRRVEEALSRGKSVIVDATNTQARNRASYVEAAVRFGVPAELHIFTTSVDECLEANRNRRRQVPEDVIRRMAQQRQEDISRDLFDFLLEGFDSIHFEKRAPR